MSTQLFPGIVHVRARLFGADMPVIQDNMKLSADGGEAEPDMAAKNGDAAIPDFLADIIARRVAAQAIAPSASPHAGLVVWVKIPETDSHHSSIAEVGVLLDRHEQQTGVWHGWMVSPDTDYAGPWDMLLEPQDEPFDPTAGMVQTWNDVRVRSEWITGVAARLSAQRLSDARSLAEECRLGVDLAEPSRPGRVAPRTLNNGAVILTGSPLGGEGDPRTEYQMLYFQASELLAQRIAEDAQRGLLDSAIEKLRSWADSAGRVLITVDWMPQPMDRSAAPSALRLDDFLDLAFFEAGGGLLGVRAKLVEEGVPVSLRLHQNGGLMSHKTLFHVGEEVEFIVKVGSGFSLLATAGHSKIEVPL